MPTYPRSESPEEIERKLKEGRGTGEKESWKAWIYTHEIPSKGISTTPWSYKLNRHVHLFSDGEFYLWFVLEYSSKVIDYWEQYPHLDLEKTMKLAEEHNIPYPMVPRPDDRSIRDPEILTTDIVASVLVNGVVEYHPMSFKYSRPLQGSRNAIGSNTLEDPGALQRLELERLSWAENGHKLRIMTEREVPGPVWRNLKEALPRYELEGLTDDDIREIALYLTRRVKKEDCKLREITRECDSRLGYEEGSGTALSVVWHLIARHKWTVDLTTLIDMDKPLKLISSSL